MNILKLPINSILSNIEKSQNEFHVSLDNNKINEYCGFFMEFNLLQGNYYTLHVKGLLIENTCKFYYSKNIYILQEISPILCNKPFDIHIIFRVIIKDNINKSEKIEMGFISNSNFRIKLSQFDLRYKDTSSYKKNDTSISSLLKMEHPIYETAICILIPISNNFELINRTITSILEQTYKNYEFILLDYGSDLNNREPWNLYEFLEKSKRVRIIKEKGNLEEILDKTILSIRSEFTTQINVGDVIKPQYLQYMIDSFKIHKQNIVYCKNLSVFRTKEFQSLNDKNEKNTLLDVLC